LRSASAAKKIVRSRTFIDSPAGGVIRRLSLPTDAI
jgi:hypothetical protein